MVKLYLSRRNLLTLLSKLDRKRAGEETKCTIIKCDTEHPTHPQSVDYIEILAMEDEDYYIDREAGFVHPKDEP